jgi:hypothetical protein
MSWYLLYDIQSGESASIGTVVADPLPSNLAARLLTSREHEELQAGRLAWDAAARGLIPAPPPPAAPEVEPTVDPE